MSRTSKEQVGYPTVYDRGWAANPVLICILLVGVTRFEFTNFDDPGYVTEN